MAIRDGTTTAVGIESHPVESYDRAEAEIRRVERLLLSPGEAARLMGIGRTKVFELIRTGQLASLRIGRARRIPRPAIDAFIEALTQADLAGADLTGADLTGART